MTSTAEPPILFILDPSPEVTGAFMAAKRQAELLAGTARCVLVLRDDARISADQLTAFHRVLRLPMRPLRRSWRSLLGYPASVIRSGRLLARMLQENGCSRLQVNDYYLLEAAVARLCGYRGRLVTWIRIDPANYGGPAARLWLAAAQRTSNSMVVVSKFLGHRVPAHLHARLLYDFGPEWPLAAPPTGLRLVFIGNYIDGKGHDVAIRAFHRIAASFPDAELVFHGGGLTLDRNRHYRAELERLAATGDGSDRIHLRGFTSDVGAALEGALAVLNLSRSESFSLVCQEASGRGVAVIATRSGGPQEIVDHGRTGWLVGVDNVGEVAEAMAEALRDPGRTAQMGREGAALVRQRFSPAEFRSAICELFDLPRAE